MKIALKSSPPNAFIGGPVPNPPGFPLKARGNDDRFISNVFFKRGNVGKSPNAIARFP
jgi:hypothetical protein